MGRLGVTAWRAYLLLTLGSVLIVVGVYLATCSIGWTLFTAGVLVTVYGLLVDVPAPSPGPGSQGVTRIGR